MNTDEKMLLTLEQIRESNAQLLIVFQHFTDAEKHSLERQQRAQQESQDQWVTELRNVAAEQRKLYELYQQVVATRTPLKRKERKSGSSESS